MPKIEISMLLEELNSEEAELFMKRVTTKVNNETVTTTMKSAEVSSDVENSTKVISTTTINSSENSTTELIKDVNDYESEISVNPEIVEDPKPMLLSEFANHLASGIKSPNSIATTQPPTPAPMVPIFTTPPDDTFPYMVSAAKEFIRRYLSPEQWRKLRLLLKTIKEVGGSRIDIHRAATLFISKVISRSEMDEITKRKSELFNTFNRRYFNRAN